MHAYINQTVDVILSGLLVGQIEELQEFFLKLGWHVLKIKVKDQWALMVLSLDLF